MAGLSISKAWDETKGRIAADGRLFLPVALAFLVLPQTVLGAFSPTTPADLGGSFFALLIIAILGSIIGQIGVARLALPPALTVGGAIRRAIRRVLPLLAAFLLACFVAALIAFACIFVVLVTGLAAPPTSGATPPRWVIFLVVIPMLLTLALFQLVFPIAAAEEGGPIKMLTRSWTLGVSSYWRLVAFLALVWIGMLLIWLSAQVIAGLAAAAIFGPPERGSVGALLVGLVVAMVQAGWTVITSVMLARIYVQLSGQGALDVSVPKSGT